MSKFRITHIDKTARFSLIGEDKTTKYSIISFPIFTVTLENGLLINANDFILINSTDILEIDG